MLYPLFLSLSVVLGSYLVDEGVTGYLPAAGPWVLVEAPGLEPTDTDGPGRVVLEFAPGRIALSGPCQRLTAMQEAPYPWFEAVETGRDTTCAPGPAEAAAADWIGRMVVAEVLGEVLILSDASADGAPAELVFRLRP